MELLGGFVRLFFSPRFLTHRLLGLSYLLQYVSAVALYLFDYDAFLRSALVWTLPLNALAQSVNAALTFTFLPKKDDPGFAAVSDKSMLSYYTVVENSFYSLQLLFAMCYLSDRLRPLIRSTVVIEPLFVFFLFFLRHLWPSSRIGASLANAKNKSDANRFTLTVSTYAIKTFYVLAKHFIGLAILYLRFLDRLSSEDIRLLYGVQLLSAYASTISIFIHTLKFKHYINWWTAMVAYDVIIPGYMFLFYNMRTLVAINADVFMLCGVGMVFNLAPKVLGVRPWFVWQLVVAGMLYGKAPIEQLPNVVHPGIFVVSCAFSIALLFRP